MNTNQLRKIVFNIIDTNDFGIGAEQFAYTLMAKILSTTSNTKEETETKIGKKSKAAASAYKAWQNREPSERTCAQCGKSVLTKNNAFKYCSLMCKNVARAQRDRMPSSLEQRLNDAAHQNYGEVTGMKSM